MVATRVIAGLGLGALIAAGLVAPALGASEAPRQERRVRHADFGGLGTFTPASADPKLAAFLARSGFVGDSFRFTPADPQRVSRHVTFTIRGRAPKVAATESAKLPTSAGGPQLAPIAYNLGASVSWKRLAVAGDVAKVDLGIMPGGRDHADVGVSYAGDRLSGRVKASVDKPLPGAPRLVDDVRSYTVDVGGSYALTRSLDVTAGVRYRADRNDRLEPLADTRPAASKAVFVGTAFRF